MPPKKFDEIPFRINVIKNILKKTSLKPMFKFNDTTTENFLSTKKKEKDDIITLLNKKTINIKEIANELQFTLLYIKSGAIGHTFKGIMKNGSAYGIKVVAYSKKEKYGDIHEPKRPENVELLMIKALSYFIITKKTAHITLPIATFDTSIIPFTKLDEKDVKNIKSNKKYYDFIKKYKAGEYYDTVSVLISEWSNRGDFLDFTKKNYMKYELTHWKVFFFQILSTLAVIQSKYPAWRHNDLKANNILISKVQRSRRRKYQICGKFYILPDIGYRLRLWDFDFSCIPNKIENNKVLAKWTKSINVSNEQNQYYDMHYFFNTLIREGFVPQIKTSKDIPKEVYEFICRVVPLKYQKSQYIHERGRILINDEFMTPKEVIENDDFFAEFRVDKL